MRLEHIVPGRRPPGHLAGAVLARDLHVGGQRWSKGRRLTAADLDAWVRASLAPYKVPQYYAFVDSLPRSGSGKTLKRELREQLLSGALRTEELGANRSAQ